MSQERIQKQLEEFQFTFDEADKDKNGSLTLSELCAVLKDQGFEGSWTEARVRVNRVIKCVLEWVWSV